MSKCCCRRGYGYGVSPMGMSPYGAGLPAAGAGGGLLGGLGLGGLGGGLGAGAGCGCGSTYGGCNFACFIILILILITFTNYNNNPCGPDGVNNGGGFFNNDNYGPIGKGILFVIALYYLSCWIPCARGGAGYY